AIRHHLNPSASVRTYSPAAQGLAPDLSGPIGPVDDMLARLDPLLADPPTLSDEQVDDLVAFVRDGLLDPRAVPDNLRKLVPKRVPGGRQPLPFEFPR